MKRVVLLRHAKSSWTDLSLEDHQRPLSKRGIKDARSLAEFLSRGGFERELDLVLCSSAIRARQTWAHVESCFPIKRGVRIVPELYLPSLAGVLELLAGVPSEIETLLLVGHNPSLEALALSLARHGDPTLRARLAEKFPTCGLCVLELPIASFERVADAKGTLRALLTPADFRGKEPEAREPRKGRAIELASPEPDVLELAQAVIEAATAQLRENAEGARLGTDPEFVHQMRVGARRLRTAFRFFKGVLDAGASESLALELTWLFRTLGPVREYDVFLEDVLAPLAAQPGLVSLRKVLRQEHAALMGDARAAIESERFTNLVRKLVTYQTELTQRRAAKHPPKLERFARKQLDRRLRKLRALAPVIKTRELTELHELRKQAKKLRYACEFVSPAFSERSTQRYLKALEALQDVLGELTDVSVGERLLARNLRHLSDRKSKQRLREQVRGRLDAGAVRAGLALPKVWERFEDTKPFWRD